MWQLRIYDMKHFWDGNYHLMELVTEVEEEPDSDSIYEIDGKTYRWCARSPKDKVVGLKEIMINNEPEEEYGDDFKCPYCGEIDHDAFELSDSGTTECGSCNSEIEYEREYSVTYTVSPVKMSKIVKL